MKNIRSIPKRKHDFKLELKKGHVACVWQEIEHFVIYWDFVYDYIYAETGEWLKCSDEQKEKIKQAILSAQKQVEDYLQSPEAFNKYWTSRGYPNVGAGIKKFLENNNFIASRHIIS